MLTIAGTNDLTGVPRGARVDWREVVEYKGKRVFVTKYKPSRHFNGGLAVDKEDGFTVDDAPPRSVAACRLIAVQYLTGLTKEQLHVSDAQLKLLRRFKDRAEGVSTTSAPPRAYQRLYNTLLDLKLIERISTPNESYTNGFSLDTKITEAGLAVIAFDDAIKTAR